MGIASRRHRQIVQRSPKFDTVAEQALSLT